jgi:hypothetical protein
MEVSIREKSLSKRASIIIGLIALIQGFGLFSLHQALDHELWPHGDWVATIMLGMLFISVPTLITLSYRDNYPQKRYWSWLTAMALIFLWIAWYSASTSASENFFLANAYFVPLCFLLAFIALFFFKAWMRDRRWPPSYESQFGFSWHNFLSFVLAWLFTFIFWLTLLLWGALFNIVDISFFKQLFKQKWFLYPTLSLAFAYAVIVFRTKINAVGAVQRILRGLISLLLPLLLMIALMFVAVLPFTGVNLIWEKGYGSDTILSFVGLTLFFFNAVYQDGKQAPYSELINLIVKSGIIILNALMALVAYGVWLRVAQYGLTVERILAIIIVALMFGYIVAYSLIIRFKRKTWSEYFGKANTSMALLTGLIILLIFTPVLDMSHISVDSQLKRLETGQVMIENFDFHYLARSGKYGLATLEKLKQRAEVKESDKLLKKIEDSIEQKGRRRYYTPDNISSERIAELAESLEVYPPTAIVDTDFWSVFEQHSNQFERCKTDNCLLLAVDLNGDKKDEYILFQSANGENVSSRLYIREIDGNFIPQFSYARVTMRFGQLRASLQAGSVKLLEPKWKDIQIGEERINTSRASELN